MNKSKLRILPLLIAAVFFSVFLLLPSGKVTASADPYINDEGKIIIETTYWFESVDVHVSVSRDKSLRVTETMRVGFLHDETNTGIIRDIQRMSRTTRIIDGEKQEGSVYLSGLSDVSVTVNGGGAKVTQGYYGNGEFFSVKMQKSDESYFPATDQKDDGTLNTFVLSYTYDMCDDKAAGYDDLTYDVLGYDMAFTRNFHAVIEFPENLNAENVSVRTNKMAAWEPNAEEGEFFSVRDNRIEITAKGYLPEGNHFTLRGYTVQALFQDGYFNTGRMVFWYYFLFLAVALLGIAAGVVLLVKYCPRKPVEQVEFYPPEGMRAMRYSAVWHGGARKKDVGAVIMQWAAEGFVTLERDGKKDLVVTKLKDLEVDGSKRVERDFDGGISEKQKEFLRAHNCNTLLKKTEELMEDRRTGKRECEYFKAMFPSGDWTGSDVFSTKKMKSGAYPERQRKLGVEADRLKDDADVPDPLMPHNLRAHILLTIFSLVPMLMMLVYQCILNLTALPVFFFVFIGAGTFVGSYQARSRLTVLMYIFPIAFTAMPLFAFSSIFYIPLYDYAGLLWISIVWWAVVLVMLHFLRRRSPEAQKELGKMRGFRNFLLTAELSRIEMLLDENPEYYYEVIPYCLIMGISDKVAKRFEALNVAAPEWAQGIPVSAFSSFSRSLSSSSGGGGGGGGGGHGGSSGGGGGGGGSRGC